MNLKREATKDAIEAAQAAMAYGEGAGNRRKLIGSAVDYKFDHVPGYAAAYLEAYATQDVVKNARAAKRARRTKDTAKFVGKNVKAVSTGDRRSLSPAVYATIVVGIVAHQTGYDKKAWAYGKRKTGDVRNWVREHI